MAKNNQGILGSFSGKIGPVTGYIRNGQNIVRSSTSNVQYKTTALRTAQLEKMRVCNQFTKAFSGTGFFTKTFPAYGSTGNGHNRVTSALLNQAIAGTYPAIDLYYPLVLISKGLLPGAEQATAEALGNGNILFSFADNSGTGTANKIDKIILVAYSPELQQAAFSLDAGLRKDGQAVLSANHLIGYTVETWIGFLNQDETHASDSVYTGRVDV